MRAVQMVLVGREQRRSSPLAESTWGPRKKNTGPYRTKITKSRRAARVAERAGRPRSGGDAGGESPARGDSELAFTRRSGLAAAGGTTALLTTPYAFEATRAPSAAGYSS